MLENLKKRKVYSGFKDNIWGADLADTQLINKFNKTFIFLLCAIKYVLVNMLRLFFWKIKKVLVLLMLFKKY